MFEFLFAHRSKQNPLIRGFSRLPVLVDITKISADQEALRVLAERGFHKGDFERSFKRYLAKSSKRKPLRLLVRRDGKRLELQILCEPFFVLRLEQLRDELLWYAPALELPERSRALYEARQHNLPLFNIEDYFRFVPSSDERPLKTPCHVCHGRGKLERRRECYYCKGDKMLGLKIREVMNGYDIGLPKDLREEENLKIYLKGDRLKRPLFPLRPQLEKLVPENTITKDDPLAASEAAFLAELEEMAEFLRLEEEVLCSNDPEEAGNHSYKLQHEALQYFREIDALRSPIKRMLAWPESFREPEEDSKLEIINGGIADNPAQHAAVIKAVSGHYPLLFIQGPPGTGKTSVIVEIIQQELARNPAAKILVSSQANLAVDNVLERLMEEKSMRLLRIGKPEKVTPLVREILIDEINPEVYRAEGWLARFQANLRDTLRRAFGRSVGSTREDFPELLARAQVVGATCIGAGSDLLVRRRAAHAERRRRVRFDLIIIDEAGRSTPMEMLVPLQLADRAIVVGDHKQLPPHNDEAVWKRWQKEHPEQTFEEMPGALSGFELWSKLVPPSCVLVLNRQFRMHPQIGDFIREVFYRDEGLTNGISAAQRALPFDGLPAALSYHSTENAGENRFEERSGTSYKNVAEAERIIKILRSLEREAREKLEVGVIAFYRAQVDLLKEMLKKEKFSKLSFSAEDGISSLDSYQGREADVILLSLVRCPKNPGRFDAEWFKFFLDCRRLNVALSRARRRLFIVGDLDQILMIKENRNRVPGFEVLANLNSYIITHDLRVN